MTMTLQCYSEWQNQTFGTLKKQENIPFSNAHLSLELYISHYKFLGGSVSVGSRSFSVGSRFIGQNMTVPNPGHNITSFQLI